MVIEAGAMVTGDDVRDAAALVVQTLGAQGDADWSVDAGPLKWSCGATLAHVSDCVLWYALHLAGRTTASDRWDWADAPAGEVAAVLSIVVPASELLASAVDMAPATSRGWHPFGMADPAGFAAMGCDELLVHASDIAAGLGVEFLPPRELCDRITGRLFPWAPTAANPWHRLLWANGRLDLPGVPHAPERWMWHCAPLSEWDGVTVPTPDGSAQPYGAMARR